MITLERTKDYELIRSIITHPRIYPWIKSDYHPPVEQFRPSESDDIHYMLAKSDGDIIGAVIVHPIHSPSTWEIHHCMLPSGWKHTEAVAVALFEWLFSETPCQTGVGFTPVCNTLACRFALKVGMKKVGVISKGYRKNGVLYDIMVSEKTRD